MDHPKSERVWYSSPYCIGNLSEMAAILFGFQMVWFWNGQAIVKEGYRHWLLWPTIPQNVWCSSPQNRRLRECPSSSIDAGQRLGRDSSISTIQQLSRVAVFTNWTFKITKWISTLNIFFQEQLLHDILFSSQQQQQRPKVYEQARTNQFVPIPEQQKPKNWWLFPPPNINIQSGSGSRQVATQERLWPLSFYKFSTQCWLPKEKLVSDFTFFEHLYLC